MILSSFFPVTFLSCRSGVTKDGRSWYSLSCYDEKGDTYRLYLSSSISEEVSKHLLDLELGARLKLFVDCKEVTTPDGKSYRLVVNDFVEDFS